MNISPNWRERRMVTPPLYYSYASYGTDAKNMNKAFAEDMLFKDFHLAPDHPLRKNLADVIVTPENMALNNPKRHLETKVMKEDTKMHAVVTPPPSGISNFLSGVMNVITNAMFSRLKPAFFSSNSVQNTALPSMWHDAKDENKDLQTENLSNDSVCSEIFVSDMSECKSAAAHCQSKLNEVRSLLCSDKPRPYSFKRRHPKKVFVEPNSVEDLFEDAFSPEDFQQLVSDSYKEYVSPVCHHDHMFHEIDGPKVKVESAMIPVVNNATEIITQSSEVLPKTYPETLSITTEIPNTICDNTKQSSEYTENNNNKLPNMTTEDSSRPENTKTVKESIWFTVHLSPPSNDLEVENKNEIVSSCEDKMTKLKLLLQERRKKSKIEQPLKTTTLPPTLNPSNTSKDIITVKGSKRYQEKLRKCRMRKSIEDDLLFANEISVDELSSNLESSPSKRNNNSVLTNTQSTEKKPTQPTEVPRKDYFDEVSGCFPSSSVESDDSFQVVFHDAPRERLSSDCDSEDSFIVFEESPDSCYTSNDVFGDDSDSTDSEDCDSDSDNSDDLDSGCGVFKLNGSLSRSVCNLADDSLYMDRSEDEVDCVTIENLNICDSVEDNGDMIISKGLLLDDRKKMLRKNLPPKRVHFSSDPPKVHMMRVWLFAARQARSQYWETFAVDRQRFKERVQQFDMNQSWIFRPQHRTRIMFQRFMPFWNAQRRKELAEKKEREAQEALNRERLRNEAIEMENAELCKHDNLNEENVVPNQEIEKVNTELGTNDNLNEENVVPNEENVVPNEEMEMVNTELGRNDILNEQNNVPNKEMAMVNAETRKNDHFNEENKNEVSNPNEGNSSNSNEGNKNAGTKPNEGSR